MRAALCFCLLLAGSQLLASAVAAPPATAPAVNTAPRTRVSLDDGWRFLRGDMPGVDASTLLYDLRPDANDRQDDRPADARPQEAVAASAPARPVLKPWILPTGNPFIKEPARRFVRPDAEPVLDLACVKPDFDDSSWQAVTLPHDWAIAGPFNAGSKGVGGGMGRLPSPGTGWYRRTLSIPAAEGGKSFFLDVDGAMSYATVWCNGHLVGGWPYGYASWRVDLTPYLSPGRDNELAIRLDNPPDSSRWYPGGGLYRHVWLTTTNPLHVAQWGTCITTSDVASSAATVRVKVSVDNDAAAAADVRATVDLVPLDEQGRPGTVSVARIDMGDLSIAAHASSTARGSVTLANPRLWGPPPQQAPNRYLAISTLTRKGETVDRQETPFGIRDIRFDPGSGLVVNGQRIAIQGVNQHHDLGALGAAFNSPAAERQLELLREMGCNAIRMAHNPPAPELLELADRMGFLVIDEVFDCWYRKKTPLDFHLIFPDWHEQDLRAMIRRDRNHPSVMLWSVGNEVGEQYTGPEGAKVASELVAIAHDEDSSRPAVSAMNFAKPDMPFPAALDVITLNYQGEGIRDTPAFANTKGIRTPPQYPAFHQKFPDKLVLSSESASAFSTRGTYLFAVASDLSGPTRDGPGGGGDSKSRLVSSYELHAADFGSSADKVFASLDHHPYVAGEFVWSGFDYLGEPTPYYASRSSYCGILDLAGFKKDRFYLYQSRWRPDLPMAHILPHWTWPERVGQITPVHVFTSGDEAELFLNGQSLGRKKKAPFEYRLRWDDVVYQPGELKVQTYKNGQPWATDTVRTAGEPARLDASADRTNLYADGHDLAFITVRITDAQGLTAPRADNPLHFSIEGPADILATDNGDPRDLTPFPSHDRRAFSGLALVILRTHRDKAGPIHLVATSKDLQSATVTLQSAPSTQAAN